MKTSKILAYTGLIFLVLMSMLSCNREERRRAEEERERRERFCEICERDDYKCFYEEDRCGCAYNEFVIATNYLNVDCYTTTSIRGNCGEITEDHYILSEHKGLASPFIEHSILEVDTTGFFDEDCMFDEKNLMSVIIYKEGGTYNSNLDFSNKEALPIIIDMDVYSHDGKYDLKGGTGNRYFSYPFTPFLTHYGFSTEERMEHDIGDIKLRNGYITLTQEKAVLEFEFHDANDTSELIGTTTLVYKRSK